MADERKQVYAVIRVDNIGDIVDRTNALTLINVKEILPSQEDAEVEVERLNILNGDKGVHYFWQATRYFPDGRGKPLT